MIITGEFVGLVFNTIIRISGYGTPHMKKTLNFDLNYMTNS
jgi:hypothetical protein